MALSEDQKAMLRLLAQREQGYDDLAALMGLSVDEVRAKVKDALAQLEAEGEPAPDVAPPEPEAPAAQPAPPEAAVSEPEASEEEPPPPPKAEAPEAAAATAPAEAKPAPGAVPRPAGRPKLSLPKDRGAQAAIGAGLLAIVVLVVVLIVGGGGGGSDESGSGGSAANGTNAAAEESSELTQAILSPVEGGEGEGRAFFGRVRKQAALQVEATGLKPSPAGSAYTIWLYKSPKLALRLGAVKVGKNGGLAVQLPIPTEVLAYVASGAFDQIDVALTSNAAYAAEVARSKKAKRLPEHVGTSVLRGPIEGPIVEKAEAEAEG
ncbi:MAG TPA: hypothetical protein VHA54_00575 [Solirubrobacterales bacterium]|nr:hypothetical protein [Solirubrobacterales bacterium]